MSVSESFFSRIASVLSLRAPDYWTFVQPATGKCETQYGDGIELHHRFGFTKPGSSEILLQAIRVVHEHGRTRTINIEGRTFTLYLANDIVAVEESQERNSGLGADSSLALMTSIIESVPNPLFVKDSTRRYIACNEAFVQFLGLPREQIIGGTVYDVAPMELAERYATFDQELFSTPGHQIRESKVMGANGQLRSVLFHKGPFKAPDGSAGIVGVIVDITDRIQLENELRSRKEILRSIFHCAPVGISITDPEGKIIENNRMSEQLLKLSREDHLRRQLDGDEWKILRPDGSVMPPEEYASTQALRTGATVTNQEMGVHTAEGVTWLSVSATPADDPAIGVIIVYTDITLRRDAEVRIKRSEERFRTLADNAPVLIWELNRSLQGVFFNRHWQEYTRGEHYLSLPPTDWLDNIYPDDRDTAVRVFGEAMRTLESFRTELRLRKSDGTYHWTHVRGVALTDNQGFLRGVLASGIDIQEQKELVAILRKARSEAEKTARTKSEFLGMISHELRTPLNGIIGSVEILLMDADRQDSNHQFLSIIQDSARSLLRVVDSIIEYTELENGITASEDNVYSVEDLASQLQTNSSHLVISKGLYWEIDVHPSVPPFVIGEPVRIRQIAHELISNAAKHTDSGSVKVHIHIAENETPTLAISVCDTGHGIAEEHLPHVFDAFYQVNSGTTRPHEGVGIGLPLARRLATSMGGDIHATSQLEKGSTFSLTVPLRRPTLVPGISTSKEEESFGDILQKRHVLIASNHSPSAQDLSLTVKRLGGTASRTRVSESTTAMVNDKKPNILMLWFTPYSGDEAMMASVAMARAMMPVIALTDSDDDEVRTRALLHGADDCLSAPGDFQTAAEVIKKAVNTTLGEKTASVLDALSKLYGYEPEILSVAIESTIEQLRTEALALANTPADDIDTIRRHINTLAVNARSGGLHSLFKIINDQEADLEQMDVATLSSFLNTVVQETALWMPHLKYALRAVYSPQQSH